ncbi:MAG: 2-amino-4-hydroxy-6-hydroxymethyldihydropteridine diphosphokinase [Prevotellaceae bacterium]|jgi:2-amino-4-hydroxy-6-hydroxymethyldihydropteridine diphosphokinase|nr:2-amino-4-hydroxy-6-hydroxymethyldihydropteridine diphosphokinase [Prevotellaceae bacterium]
MPKLYLGLGSNLGDRKKNITDATMICAALIGTIEALSSLYETEPWGFSSPNKFLNAVICLETDKDPWLCLALAKGIEREMGRVYSCNSGYEDRIIDIDILLYDDLILQTENLTIPHPHMKERDFVLRPLAEIAPGLKHPVSGESIEQLLHNQLLP